MKPVKMTWEELQDLGDHPAAAVFPLISGLEAEAFYQSMRSEGYDQDKPIIVCQGQILDGRNRRNMALRLHAEGLMPLPPPVQEYEGDDPVEYSFRENLARRHLTGAQIAVALARRGQLGEEEVKARERQVSGLKRGDTSPVPLNSGERGEAASIIAKQHGLSRYNVQYGKTLLNHAPDLAEKVERGEINMNTAVNEWRRRRGMPPIGSGRKKGAEKPKASKKDSSWENVWKCDGIARGGILYPQSPNGNDRMAVFAFSFTYTDLAAAARTIKQYLTATELETFINELRDQPVQSYPVFDHFNELGGADSRRLGDDTLQPV